MQERLRIYVRNNGAYEIGVLVETWIPPPIATFKGTPYLIE